MAQIYLQTIAESIDKQELSLTWQIIFSSPILEKIEIPIKLMAFKPTPLKCRSYKVKLEIPENISKVE